MYSVLLPTLLYLKRLNSVLKKGSAWFLGQWKANATITRWEAAFLVVTAGTASRFYGCTLFRHKQYCMDSFLSKTRRTLITSGRYLQVCRNSLVVKNVLRSIWMCFHWHAACSLDVFLKYFYISHSLKSLNADDYIFFTQWDFRVDVSRLFKFQCTHKPW